jgi:hypothetical protein
MQDETGEWVDEVWAEGGAALDEDTKTIALFGCNEIAEPDVRQVFVKLMTHLWAPRGWTVRWAEDISEVAAQVGVDPETVQSESFPFTIKFDQFGKNFAENNYGGLLSVRTGGTWLDRVVDFTMVGVLMNGPGVLDALETLPDLPTVRERHANRPLKSFEKKKGALGDQVKDYALVDTDARAIHLSLWFPESDQLAFLREKWDGWSISLHDEGAEGHFRRMGRELPADLIPTIPPEPEEPDRRLDPRSVEECIEIIERIMFGTDAQKDAIAKTFTGVMNHLGKTVQKIGRGFDKRPSAAAIDELSARERFDDAVAAALAETDQSS